MKKFLYSIVLVLLLFASIIFLLVDDVKAQTIFSDGFESGNLTSSNWNTNGTGGVVVSTLAHSGYYSADFPLSRHDCYAIKTLTTPMSTINYTSYVYFSGLCNDYICMVLGQDANANIMHYRVTNVNGNYQWQFNVKSSQVINSSSPAPQIGRWYKIQLLAIVGNNGTFIFIVDDQIRATITNQTFGSITQVRIGHDWDEGYIGGDVYFDDVSIAPISSPIVFASATNGGAITPNGAITVNPGGYQNFNITASTGYHITDVLVDGNSLGPLATYNFTNIQLGTIHTIAASFAINTFNIQASADINGQISPTGNLVVNYGTDKTFTITANSGYHISNVIVNGTSVGAVTSYTFSNIAANYVISASFDVNPAPTPVQTSSPISTISPNTPAETSTPQPSTSQTPKATIDASSTPPDETAPTDVNAQDSWLLLILITSVMAAAFAGAFIIRKRRNN